VTEARRPLLITGASGFLGGAVARLALRQGYDVHALARPTSDRSELGGDVTWHSGDLTDEVSVDHAVRAVRELADERGRRARVVHAAAVISYRTRDAELQRRVNVDGTRTMVAAAQRSGVARLLHVSSVVAVGWSRAAGEVLDETAAFNGAELGVDYVTTKRAAEECVLGADLDVVVVNPGAIFGPNPRAGNSSRFLEAVRSRRTGPFAPPGGLSAVGIEDAARGCLLALELGRRGRRYLLTESYRDAVDLFREVAAAFGVRPVRSAAPRALWRAAELAARAVDRVRPLELTTPQALRILGIRFCFDAARARAELGWRPRPFSEVLREAVASHTATHTATHAATQTGRNATNSHR